MTHWKKLTNPNYLGAYSIEDGKDLILTIGSVSEETVIGADGKKEQCVVCRFEEPNTKPMILNSTNMKMISKLLKTPYVEEWRGHRIQIGTEKVKAFGEIVDALRVKSFLPAAEANIKCEGCGKSVKAAAGLSADKLAAYTKSKYGKTLCADCAAKRKKETEAAEVEKAH